MSTETKNVRLRAEVYDKMLKKFANSMTELLGDEYVSVENVHIDLNGYEIKYINGTGKKMRRFYTHDENPVVKTVVREEPKPKAKAKTKAKPKTKPVPRLKRSSK